MMIDSSTLLQSILRLSEFPHFPAFAKSLKQANCIHPKFISSIFSRLIKSTPHSPPPPHHLQPPPMAAALLLGNLALLADASSQWTPPPDRPAAPAAASGGPKPLTSAKRDPLLPLLSAALGKPFHDPDRRKPAAAAASGFDAASGGGGDGGGGGGGDDWEEKLRTRLKEMEEMKELERSAAELQSRVAADDGPESEEVKRERVRRELEKVAREQAERRQTAQLMFDLGQRAYGRGMYSRAIDFFEGALTIIPRPTLFGGEIQIWLAMAYEANNRHRDCIVLYEQLEKKHPSLSIRRQAKELRYILQAPKLKISKDEMVSIPLIGSSYDSYAGFWSDKYKDREPSKVTTTNQLPSSKDFLGDFLVWRPPSGLEKNSAFWVIVTLWLGLLGTALLLQR